MRFQSLISQVGRPVNPAEALANRSSKWIARHFGISRRQAQRYKSGHATLDRPQDRTRRDRVMGSADSDTRRKVAADSLRNAQAVHVGRIQVTDKSPKKREARREGRNFRNVGTVQLDPRSQERMSAAADALEAGDAERAEKLLGEAVLQTAGKDYGSALDVADWPPGFHVI